MLFGYIIMCLIFGTTYLTIKIGLEDGMPPFLFASLRFFIAGSLILIYLKVRNRFTSVGMKQYIHIAYLGVLTTTIPFAALFWAEQYISSGMAALLVASAPIFTTFIGILQKQIQFHWFIIIGSLLGIFGVYFIMEPQEIANHNDKQSFFAKLFILVSEMIFAYGIVKSKQLLKEVSTLTFNGLQMFFASLALFIISIFSEDITNVHITLTSSISIIYLAIVASIFASGIYYWLLKETNPTFPTTWTYVSPIIAMAVGSLFLNEHLSLINIIGAIFILFGIILLNSDVWKSIIDMHNQKAKHRKIKNAL
jgi:drug/metabolite transporter (DMT)-like permease